MNPLPFAVFPETDPTSVYRPRDGLYGSDLLAAAIVHLDFFTWLVAKGQATAGEICAGLELNARPVDVMLTYFAAMGFLRREGANVFPTSIAREHLNAKSPWFLGPYYASLKDRPVVKDFAQVLRTDRAANWGSFKDENAWAKAMEDEKFAKSFTAAMDCRGVYLGHVLAKTVETVGFSRLLDIAGGSGIYACAFAILQPHLKATVFEKPPVDQVAARCIRERGCEGRVSVRAGDVFHDELPAGHDVHLISNVLHDWDFPKAREIVGKSFRAMPSGGMVVVHDAYINADKTGPAPVAAYSAMLMHSTEGKCYSTAEMFEMLQTAGFQSCEHLSTAADRGVVTARKP